ncbi:hypothetical protein M9458_006682, partial [Cirrhinus mrigala]
TDTKAALKSPPTRYECSSDGYSMIAKNIPLFQAINLLPIRLDTSRLDDGGGIEDTLRRNGAMYHQNCRKMFSNYKLKRATKRAAETQNDPGEGHQKIRRASTEVQQCFLCEKMEPTSEMRQAMTMQLNERLNECARNLNDGKLLALLSGGDVVALELKYHWSCLTDLYHRERAHIKAEKQEKIQSSQEKEAFHLVFSELLTYVIEAKKTNSDGPSVFRLAELVNLYRERLKQFGTDLPDVNATRLKERLLAEIPGLVAYKKGRDILLAFEKDVGPVLSEASSDADAIILAKAAQILRRHMVNHKSKFEGNLYESSVHDSFPPALLQFVCMIEHGADIKSQLKFGATTNDLAMAQLLQYNCFAKCKEGAATQRHSRDRETPFPVYIGMSIYAKTRKRHLVEMLHDHGLSIPYNRVLDISAQLGDAVVNRYIEEGLVCPPKLRKGLFCTSAMDNIDHNPSSTTATSSFHGTSISIFQHTSSENQGEVREPILIKNSSVKKVPELPDSYTNVHPAFFTKKKPSPPKGNVTYASLPTLLLTNEYEWLQKVSLTQDVDDEVNITWSAHHAEKKRGLAFDVSITSLFPLLRDEAHSIATVRHTMNKVRDAIAHLNPGQVPVITADQPIYSIAKQVQWHWPDLYGEDKFVVMFGGLHIEMAAFRSLGTLLQSSGWTGALVEAVVASSGTADSFLSASSVTRTCHMHQVTACCLYMLRKEAYEYHCADQNDGALNFNDWCEKCRKESPQFQFWELVLSMELVIFSLVRSFREANFNLYCQALSALIPFFFANNNVNYARWLPIHLRDMVSLEQTHPQIFNEFQLGKFVVHKTHREFSGIAIDQAHEQANAVVKGDGGAIGVTEDPSALRQWMVSGPEVSQLVNQYELASEVNEATEDIRHHEQTRQSQKSFTDKVQRLFAVMKDLGNPFQEESKDLLTLDTKNIAHPSAAELVRTHLEKGQVAFRDFFNGLGDETSFYRPIKKNKVDFFRQEAASACSDMKKQVLKDDCRLFSQLFISCQSRECDLLEFFKHENQSFPAALSDTGKLYYGQKSQLANILEATISPPDKQPECGAIIIDGSSLVYSLSPKTSKTFEEYAVQDVVPKIQAYSSKYERTDIIFDVYWTSSLKAETRSNRGKGGRRRVTDKTKLPPNWKSFLRDNENKTELFGFLAEKIVTLCPDNVVVVTKGEQALSNKPISLEGLSPCNHEEADSRIFTHALHATKQQIKSVLIKACDTDILVVAVNVFATLQDAGLEKIWIEFGQGQSIRWLPIHDMVVNLGPEKSSGMLFFHAFTGCDVVSAFRGKSKKSAWQAWEVCPEVSPVFKKLSQYPPIIEDADLNILEKFVITMYDKQSTTCKVDEARLDLFARKQRSYDAIPPTSASLVQHVKRSAFQAACIWGQATVCKMQTESPANWGWQKDGQIWQVLWTTLPPIAQTCEQLTKCGCKTECQGRCKCYRFGLKCTQLCACACEG